MNQPTPGNETQWERDLLQRFAFEALREQRRARRWGIFFRLLAFGYVLAFLAAAWQSTPARSGLGGGKVTGLVDIQGVIAPGAAADADRIITGLRAAFEDSATRGVIVRINSPGGSPVQAGYINDEINRLKNKYPKKKLYAVVQDICASGGYYIAVAADEIYADKGSLVGSIGVRMDSFGLVDAISKLGVERRLITAGEHKGFLDPFLPLDAQETAHARSLLGDIHDQFTNTVKRGRGARLKDNPEIFSGLIWTGERALELGLVDALGSSGFVAREIIKAEEIVDFTPKEGLVEELSRHLGTASLEAAQKIFGTSLR
ncbi:MAG: S49 family peptidase [Gammaproteobacteria bacterium]|nr:S49 family peptidase [Gammaproteobacteria bacterium]